MKTVSAISLLVVVLASAQALAQGTSVLPADNTKSNALPANSELKASIADGQTNMTSDLKITQQIRKRIIADKNLSPYAHNVKIVSVNGAVTLNGVVRSVHERSVVEMKAQAVVGKDKVTNDLSVAPNG